MRTGRLVGLIVGAALVMPSCQSAAPPLAEIQASQSEDRHTVAPDVAVTESPIPSPIPEADPPPPPQVPPAPTPLAWSRVVEGPFSFELPADMVRQDVGGIDSQVGEFSSDRMLLHYDYGKYGGDPNRPDAPDFREAWVQIDDREAHVSYWRNSPDLWGDDRNAAYEFQAGVFFPNATNSPEPTPGPSGVIEWSQFPTTLNVSVFSHDGWEAAERIFASIRFGDV